VPCFRKGIGGDPDPSNCRPCFREIIGHPLDPANLSSASLFVIEDGADASKGGILTWQRTYCLRHLASGLYLTRGDTGAGRSDSLLGGGGLDEGDGALQLTRERNPKRSVFAIHQSSGRHHAQVGGGLRKWGVGWEDWGWVGEVGGGLGR
jgi:hypothetical protein